MITGAVVRLLEKQRYYGQLLLEMERIYKPMEFVAGVAVLETGIKLFVDPEKFAEKSHAEQEGILIHECNHILRLHAARKGERDHMRFNIAADKAINQLISELDSVADICRPTGKEELNKAAEYYYETEETKKQAEEMKPQALDDHSHWGKISEELARGLIHKACKNAADRCAGSVPGHIQVLIEAMSANTVPWTQLLRRRVGNAMESVRHLTRTRPNRRFGSIFMGNRTEPLLRVASCMDVSGSVSDQELAQYYGELKYLHNMGVEITVIQADAVVSKVEKYKPSKSYGVTGRGGTLYNPALEAAKKEGVDLIVYFGDMDAADVPNNPGIPVIWVSSSGQKPPADFGHAIYVDKAAA